MASVTVSQESGDALLIRAVSSAKDAIIVTDAGHRVLTLNAAAERLFGCSTVEASGQPLTRFMPDHRLGTCKGAAEQTDPGVVDLDGGFDTFTVTTPGREDLIFDVAISRAAWGTETLFTLILRDVTGRRAADDQVRRLNNLYAALNQINQVIAASKNRHEMFRAVCRSLVELGGFRMAWVGWRSPETDALIPVAAWGDDSGYLQKIKVFVDERPEGRGASGTAFRGGRPVVSDDVLGDSRFAPWRAEAEALRLRSAAALPIRSKGEVCGTLNVYAIDVGVFKDKEMMLLAEAARDLSFGLDNFAREEARASAEAAARRERMFIDAMIESTPGILYLYNDQGRFLRWNRQFEVVSGYSAAEIASMRPADFFAPENKERLEAKIAEGFAQGSSSLEAPFVAKDGRATPYFLTRQQVSFEGMNCLVGVGIDISDAKTAYNELEASERRHRTTLDSILEACVLIGFDWQYLYLNDAAAIQYHRPKAEFLGRTMQDVWPGIERTSAFVPIRRCMEERVALSQEVKFVFPDGALRWFDLRVQPVPEGVFLLSIDVTDRHEAARALSEMNLGLEQKVAERTDDLRRALIRAEAADRTKSAFLATMSHELRTPLNSIIGFTGILAQGLAGPVNDEQSKQLGMVRASSRHLLALINDVLDISKIEAGELEVEFKPFDIIESVRKIVELMMPAAQAKGLALDLHTALPPTQLTSDQRRVEQILLNLVNNAVKFTEHGGVTIVVSADRQRDAALRIDVADTGVGIKPEDLEVLFQPFRQIQDGIARPYEGTGLGLAISRRLADLLGAQVEVDSEWGRGSVFTLTLPLAAGDTT